MHPPHDIRNEALDLLVQCRTASLATCGPDGQPHAANIQYVCDDQLRLYYVSGKDALHSRHLTANPRAAATVYHHDDTDSKTIRGVQLHGAVDIPKDKDVLREVTRKYKDRFPFIKTNPILLAAIKLQGFYRFTPTWARLVDNRKRFGWKAELELAAED